MMTVRRLFVGVVAMGALAVLAWGKPAGDHHPTDPAHVTASTDSNHDEAASRFRAGQSSHWRHVMIGR